MIKIIYLLFLAALRPNDKLLRFKLLRRFGKSVMPEYRFHWPQIDWWEDEYFNSYLTRFDEMGSPNVEQRWMIYQLLRLTEQVSGDTAECGVYKGATSWLICMHNRSTASATRTHFMFDSYSGLSSPTSSDGSHWTEGDLSYNVDKVRDNMTGLEHFELLQGWIPERFSEVEDRNFSFVHIDVDLYQPTLDSIAFFYSRMNKGGIIACDDYGLTSCPGATKAIDEFLADKPEKMIQNSCGGGFMVKGLATGKPAELTI
jgi:hypothetical protein